MEVHKAVRSYVHCMRETFDDGYEKRATLILIYQCRSIGLAPSGALVSFDSCLFPSSLAFFAASLGVGSTKKSSQ